MIRNLLRANTPQLSFFQIGPEKTGSLKICGK